MQLLIRAIARAALSGWIVAAIPSPAQVHITGLTPGGLLSWENPVTNSIHQVQQAATPMGPWQALALVTNQNWLQLTNPPSARTNSRFLRVAWAGATMWSYSGYDKLGSLLAQGTVYLAPSEQTMVRGSWALEPVGPVRSRHALGTGLVTGTMANSRMHLDFNPGFYDNNFTLEWVFPAGTNIYAGGWTYAGFAVLDSGTFKGLKLPTGD